VAGDDRDGLANIGPCSPRLKGSVALSGIAVPNLS
jgi:hypothetical protein